MSAYYNDNDPLKAEVIREAIKAGAIAPGDVDERSISDIRPGDLVGYTQCHFFAGGGFWSLALRAAGVPDWWPCWTGSCPCPSFSAAGKGGGFDDPRHLWPDWFKLIRECRPPVIFGEQADDAVGYGWVDLVQAGMEAEAYAFGKAVFGAHSRGAPHIRQRLYFCADTGLPESQGRDGASPGGQRLSRGISSPRSTGVTAGLGAHTDADGCLTHAGSGLHHQEHHTESCLRASVGSDAYSESSERRTGELPGAEAESGGARLSDGRGSDRPQHGQQAISGSDAMHPERRPEHIDGEDGRHGQDGGRPEAYGFTGTRGEVLGSLDPLGQGLQGHLGDVREWRGPGWLDPLTARSVAEAGATRGFWADCDWWYGRDGKYRPIGPGIQPLAHGSPARVGRLRLYGDGIVVTQATEFIKAYLEARGITL